jgi:hypothetical protein
MGTVWSSDSDSAAPRTSLCCLHRKYNTTDAQVLGTLAASNTYANGDVIDLDKLTEVTDTNGIYVAGVDSITIPSDGMYEISWYASLADSGGAATTSLIYIGVNGAEVASSGIKIGVSLTGCVSVEYLAALSSGDVIDFRCSTDSWETVSLVGSCILIEQRPYTNL